MSKTDKLENTGERMIPEYHKGTFIYGEHIVRYGAVAEIVKDKDVLDIACGSGYGTQMLSQKARHVYGVDIDEPAIAYAKKHYSAKNVSFLLGDAVSIPLEDNSVDMVITFETIEHIQDYEHFMREIKRVLRPDGVAVISTPNDAEFSEGNHFHIHEFKHKELMQLIGKYFKNTDEYFQGTWIYNALLTPEHFTKDWEGVMPVVQSAAKPIEKCLYFYVVCSDEPIKIKPTETGAISHHWSARDEQKAGDEADAYVKSLKEHIDARESELQHLKKVQGQLRARVERLDRNPIIRLARLIKGQLK